MSPSVPVAPTQRPESVCERWRTSLIEHYGGKPEPQQYVPQCEPDGQFRYTKHTHTLFKKRFNLFFNDKLLEKVNCLSVQSSVMERPLTAGVWTRTGGRFLVPDHMMLSNLRVSIFSLLATTCLFTWSKLHVLSWLRHFFFLTYPISSQAFPQWPLPPSAHCPAQM